jgi:hypothetical protein
VAVAREIWDCQTDLATVVDAGEDPNAMLLERCEPGTSLWELSEEDQDVVVTGLLRRLWRVPPSLYPFRPGFASQAWISCSVLCRRRSGYVRGNRIHLT